jgi:hypothetical protein
MDQKSHGKQPSGRTPERGTAAAAPKEQQTTPDTPGPGAASRGKEPISKQNKHSSEE